MLITRSQLFLFNLGVRYHHAYKPASCPPSKWAEKLLDNLLYNKDGIVVLNKPYGISFAQTPHSEKEIDCETSLITILPFLKKLLGYPQLLNAKIPERYISGVAIFGTDENKVDKIKTGLRETRQSGVLQDTYKAVVVGYPQSKYGEFKGGITLHPTANTNKNGKRAELVTEWSRKKIKSGEIVRVKMAYETIKEGEWSSLVKINSNRNKWHCVRAYLASKLLSPVLGDDIFGSRVKLILGAPVLVDVTSPAILAPQKIPNELKKRLNLEGRANIDVPLHLHLSEITINDFDRKGNQITFSAPTPEVFNWTCEKLSLT